MRKIFTNTLSLAFRKSNVLNYGFSQQNKIRSALITIPIVYQFSTIMMNDTYDLLLQDDFKDGEMREFQVGPKKEDAVLVVRVNGKYYCVSNSCPHFGAPLSAGLLVGDKVKCPWHNAAFSVIDGSFEEGPMFNGLQTFPVELVDGKISIKIQKDLLNKGRVLNMATRGQDPTHYVIIGGGVSGQSAAESLRQAGFQGQITIISAESLLPYDRTGMSKALFQVGPQGLQVRNQEFYTKYGIDLKTNSWVEDIDYDNQNIKVNGQSLHYDKLLLATGGQARRPKVDGVNLKNIYTLRQFSDAQGLRESAKTAKNIVIIGASFIGLETATSLRREVKDAKIIVVDSNATPFQRVLGKEVGKALQKLHEDNGVQFVLNAKLQQFTGDDGVKQVVLSNGTKLDADVVLLGTGIEPNTKLAQNKLKIAPDGGIQTDIFLKARQNVYVSGDVASYPYWVTGEQVRVEHHNEAIHQGYIAALNMIGKPTPLSEIPFFWTRHWDKSLQYSGIGNGFDQVVIDGDLNELKFVAYYGRKGKVVASASMNVPNAQMIISEALRLNVVPSLAEIQEKKITLDQIKQLVQAKQGLCACKRSGQCGSKL
ncbi:hypothetical protein pb186bvf_018765 [Paramecium bursaria]